MVTSKDFSTFNKIGLKGFSSFLTSDNNDECIELNVLVTTQRSSFNKTKFGIFIIFNS